MARGGSVLRRAECRRYDEQFDARSLCRQFPQRRIAHRRSPPHWASSALATLLGAKGCDPNYIGVQDYGSIAGNVVDQKGTPLASAIVSVGSLATIRSDAKGGFVLPHVPVGEQTVQAQAAGYISGSVTVIVAKDKTGFGRQHRTDRVDDHTVGLQAQRKAAPVGARSARALGRTARHGGGVRRRLAREPL